MIKKNNDPFGFNKAINWKKLEDPKVIEKLKNITSNYSMAQILAAWEAAYGEDMRIEYPGFIQRLSEENARQAGDPGEGSNNNKLRVRT